MAEIRLYLRKEDAGTRAPYTELLFFLAGVLGPVFLVREVRGFSFSLWVVCPASVLLCGGLWYSRRKGPRATAMALAGLALLSAAGIFLFREKLSVQLRSFGEAFFSAPASAPTDAAGAVLLLTAGVVSLLFVGECLLNCHPPFAVLASLLPLFWVSAGFRVSLWALVFLALFTGGFWVIRGQKDVSLPRTGSVTALLILAALLLAWSVAARFSRALSLPAYRAEEAAYRVWRSFSGTAAHVSGDVSRGNHYQTGAVLLELSATRRPSEPLYLRGFAGGGYIGRRWLPAEDEALLERVKETLNWGKWSNMVGGIYQTMYYVVNQYVIQDDPPSPMRITIRCEGDKYPVHFAPYYSRLTGNRLTAEDGYTCEFYEQGDMLLDWERVPDSFSTQRDWSRTVYEAYAREAAAAYTAVPADRLPRLARLAAEHPLDDMDEITAFILQVLRENAVYSQTPGWTPMGEEVVENFLFEKHSGYCVHYASAAVLLYRLYGVPARYAAGYLVPPEEFSPNADGTWEAAVTDGYAHAWAEIFLPDYGWTPVEVTPDAGGEIAARYPGFALSTANRHPGEESGDIPVAIPEQDAASSAPNRLQAGGSSPENPRQWALWLYLTGCSAILGFLLLDARREKLLRRQNTEGCRKVFSRLLELFRFCGVLAGCDGTEPDFPQRAAQALPPVSLSEWETVLQYAAMAAYGRAAPGPAADAFVREVYQRSARFLLPHLPWHKKLLFRLWKVFL